MSDGHTIDIGPVHVGRLVDSGTPYGEVWECNPTCPHPDHVEGVMLTDDESRALAWRLVAMLVDDWMSHVEWESVPLLSERSWVRLAEELPGVAVDVRRMADEYAERVGVDARALWAHTQ